MSTSESLPLLPDLEIHALNEFLIQKLETFGWHQQTFPLLVLTSTLHALNFALNFATGYKTIAEFTKWYGRVAEFAEWEEIIA